MSDTEITFTGTYTCTNHNDRQRVECPVCLVASLTTERDQLRSEFEKLAITTAQAQDRNVSHRLERDKAEAERTDAIYQRACEVERDLRAQLHALQLVCGTNDANKFETWVDRANARAERAETELAAERSRLNWLDQQGAHYGWKVQLPADYPYVKECVFVCRNTTSGHKTIREAIDAAMKEGK